MGIFPRDEALKIAKEEGLDLIEVAPKANPSVCRLLDYGKFKYERDKRRKKNKKRQSADTLKEIRLSYKIGEHDLKVKMKKIEKFLDEGHRVKLSIWLKGRERIYKEEGKQILEDLAKKIGETRKIESHFSGSGRKIEQYITPK